MGTKPLVDQAETVNTRAGVLEANDSTNLPKLVIKFKDYRIIQTARLVFTAVTIQEDAMCVALVATLSTGIASAPAVDNYSRTIPPVDQFATTAMVRATRDTLDPLNFITQNRTRVLRTLKLS